MINDGSSLSRATTAAATAAHSDAFFHFLSDPHLHLASGDRAWVRNLVCVCPSADHCVWGDLLNSGSDRLIDNILQHIWYINTDQIVITYKYRMTPSRKNVGWVGGGHRCDLGCIRPLKALIFNSLFHLLYAEIFCNEAYRNFCKYTSL